ncbi:uncharacterized protein [Arachis hypogaea]|uniref:uncharacterized protein n=1 Tax=Arachis hypogaea TaxID=3818 RepID=UPI003B21B8FC
MTDFRLTRLNHPVRSGVQNIGRNIRSGLNANDIKELAYKLYSTNYDALSNIYLYFQQRIDATGKRGLSPLKKCTATIRMLAYGVAADAIDDYVHIDESTIIECLKKFVGGVILVFEDEYLRKPNSNDVRHLQQMAEGRGFPGMLGSIDCIHWQ